MSNMQIFNYQNNEVRTVEMNGEPWFVLKDVCDVLGLSDTGRTAERLDADELTRTTLVSGGQNREMYIINESGLYNVILRSDKPEAKPFRKWVTSEVLPSIRKNGGILPICFLIFFDPVGFICFPSGSECSNRHQTS